MDLGLLLVLVELNQNVSSISLLKEQLLTMQQVNLKFSIKQ